MLSGTILHGTLGVKYSDNLTPFHPCPKLWTSPFYYMFLCKTCWISGIYCRPWSDTVFSSVCSESVLSSQDCLNTSGLSEYFKTLSEYLRLIWYSSVCSESIVSSQDCLNTSRLSEYLGLIWYSRVCSESILASQDCLNSSRLWLNT